MERFAVVVARLIEAGRGAAARETGGIVLLIPDPKPEDWQARVAALARRRFQHGLGPVVELGHATLDRALVERHCREDEGLYWQGGDG